MKVFKAEQIRLLDQLTIEREPVSSVDLMERAAEALFESFVARYEDGRRVCLFAGNGNNGGDALVLARLLSQLKTSFEINVFMFDSIRLSADCAVNLARLSSCDNVLQTSLVSQGDFPLLSANDIVVDALFGTGLSRPVEGLAADLISYINNSDAEVFSIDIPSGLFAEDNTNNTGAIIEADVTISFQFPKLAFLLSDNEKYLGEWEVWDIGLDYSSIEEMETAYRLLEDDDAISLLKPRNKFSHKGTFGHALLVTGQQGMMGAAMLATKACLRSGTGLVTTHVPHTCGGLIQSYVPEALLSLDRSELMFTDEIELNSYQAVGVGPGIGTKPNTQKALSYLLKNCQLPLVLDADALNILNTNRGLLDDLPPNTILTPHPKEFDRLTHPHDNAYNRLNSQLAFAQNYDVIVVLKGAHTSIAFPDGTIYFNITGNHGMATGGMGDVLTGIIVGLLAQGYSSQEAALLGVWWHGKAADLFAHRYLAQSMMASDVIGLLKEVLN